MDIAMAKDEPLKESGIGDVELISDDELEPITDEIEDGKINSQDCFIMLSDGELDPKEEIGASLTSEATTVDGLAVSLNYDEVGSRQSGKFVSSESDGHEIPISSEAECLKIPSRERPFCHVDSRYRGSKLDVIGQQVGGTAAARCHGVSQPSCASSPASVECLINEENDTASEDDGRDTPIGEELDDFDEDLLYLRLIALKSMTTEGLCQDSAKPSLNCETKTVEDKNTVQNSVMGEFDVDMVNEMEELLEEADQAAADEEMESQSSVPEVIDIADSEEEQMDRFMHDVVIEKQLTRTPQCQRRRDSKLEDRGEFKMLVQRLKHKANSLNKKVNYSPTRSLFKEMSSKCTRPLVESIIEDKSERNLDTNLSYLPSASVVNNVFPNKRPIDTSLGDVGSFLSVPLFPSPPDTCPNTQTHCLENEKWDSIATSLSAKTISEPVDMDLVSEDEAEMNFFRRQREQNESDGCSLWQTGANMPFAAVTQCRVSSPPRMCDVLSFPNDEARYTAFLQAVISNNPSTKVAFDQGGEKRRLCSSRRRRRSNLALTSTGENLVKLLPHVPKRILTPCREEAEKFKVDVDRLKGNNNAICTEAEDVEDVDGLRAKLLSQIGQRRGYKEENKTHKVPSSKVIESSSAAVSRVSPIVDDKKSPSKVQGHKTKVQTLKLKTKLHSATAQVDHANKKPFSRETCKLREPSMRNKHFPNLTRSFIIPLGNDDSSDEESIVNCETSSVPSDFAQCLDQLMKGARKKSCPKQEGSTNKQPVKVKTKPPPKPVRKHPPDRSQSAALQQSKTVVGVRVSPILTPRRVRNKSLSLSSLSPAAKNALMKTSVRHLPLEKQLEYKKLKALIARKEKAKSHRQQLKKKEQMSSAKSAAVTVLKNEISSVKPVQCVESEKLNENMDIAEQLEIPAVKDEEDADELRRMLLKTMQAKMAAAGNESKASLSKAEFEPRSSVEGKLTTTNVVVKSPTGMPGKNETPLVKDAALRRLKKQKRKSAMRITTRNGKKLDIGENVKTKEELVAKQDPIVNNNLKEDLRGTELQLAAVWRNITNDLFKLSASISHLKVETDRLETANEFLRDLKRQMVETEALIRKKHERIKHLKTIVRNCHQQVNTKRLEMDSVEKRCYAVGKEVFGPSYVSPQEGGKKVRQKLALIRKNFMDISLEAENETTPVLDSDGLQGTETAELKNSVTASLVGSALAHLHPCNKSASLDPHTELCRFELQGKCNDDACAFQHQIAKAPVSTKPPEKDSLKL